MAATKKEYRRDSSCSETCESHGARVDCEVTYGDSEDSPTVFFGKLFKEMLHILELEIDINVLWYLYILRRGPPECVRKEGAADDPKSEHLQSRGWETFLRSTDKLNNEPSDLEACHGLRNPIGLTLVLDLFFADLWMVKVSVLQ